MWILGLKRLTLENLYTLDLVIFSLICHKILNKEKINYPENVISHRGF